MPYRKRSSPVLEKSERRAASIGSIDLNLDLGNGLTLPGYITSIEIVRQKVAEYNTMLSNVAQLYDEMMVAEQQLADLNTRMLAGVLTKYGRNSIEYEMAGGKRSKSKRGKAIGSGAASLTTGSTAMEFVSVPSVNGSQNGSGSSNGSTSTVM